MDKKPSGYKAWLQARALSKQLEFVQRTTYFVKVTWERFQKSYEKEGLKQREALDEALQDWCNKIDSAEEEAKSELNSGDRSEYKE